MRDVQAITSAGRSHTDQLKNRTRNYLISMGIRTAAFVAAVFTDGWIRWTCVGLAFVLPYIAVLMANSGAEKRVVPSSYLDDHALEAGGGAGPDDLSSSEGADADPAAPSSEPGHHVIDGDALSGASDPTDAGRPTAGTPRTGEPSRPGHGTAA